MVFRLVLNRSSNRSGQVAFLGPKSKHASSVRHTLRQSGRLSSGRASAGAWANNPPQASVTGLNQHLDIFPTVQAAITGQCPLTGAADARTGIAAYAAYAAYAQPAHAHTWRARRAADGGELRIAIAAPLGHADAWRDADPRR
jgi:hypothetical protein